MLFPLNIFTVRFLREMHLAVNRTAHLGPSSQTARVLSCGRGYQWHLRGQSKAVESVRVSTDLDLKSGIVTVYARCLICWVHSTSLVTATCALVSWQHTLTTWRNKTFWLLITAVFRLAVSLEESLECLIIWAIFSMRDCLTGWFGSATIKSKR